MALMKRALQYAANVLQVYQVAPPLPSYGAAVTTQTLVSDYVFAHSYGEPYTVSYTPPDVGFDEVQLGLDLQSFGMQYDRLAHIYLNNVEVWRPSTPEPCGHNITFSFSRDVSAYSSLFKKPGQLVFYLDNIVNDDVDGYFQATLTVSYFDSGTPEKTDEQWFYGSPATDISSLHDGTPLETAPGDVALTIPQLDKSVARVGVQVFASGNGNEEFWYENELNATGPTRFIELYVGDQLAGYIDPFQPLYTGGINPRMWWPLIGIRAADIPSYYIDLSWALPTLWDASAPLTLKIVNGFDSQSVDGNWLMNIALFEWKDSTLQGVGGTPSSSNPSSASPTVYNSTDMQYVGLNRSVHNYATLQFNSKSIDVAWIQQSIQLAAQLNQDNSFYVHYAGGQSQCTFGSDTYQFIYAYPRAILGDGDDVSLDYAYEIQNTAGSGSFAVSTSMQADWGYTNTSTVTNGYTLQGNSETQKVAAAQMADITQNSTSAGIAIFGANAKFSQLDGYFQAADYNGATNFLDDWSKELE